MMIILNRMPFRCKRFEPNFRNALPFLGGSRFDLSRRIGASPLQLKACEMAARFGPVGGWLNGPHLQWVELPS